MGSKIHPQVMSRVQWDPRYTGKVYHGIRWDHPIFHFVEGSSGIAYNFLILAHVCLQVLVGFKCRTITSFTSKYTLVMIYFIQIVLILQRGFVSCIGKGGELMHPLGFFENNLRTDRPIVTKLGKPNH